MTRRVKSKRLTPLDQKGDPVKAETCGTPIPKSRDRKVGFAEEKTSTSANLAVCPSSPETWPGCGERTRSKTSNTKQTEWREKFLRPKSQESYPHHGRLQRPCPCSPKKEPSQTPQSTDQLWSENQNPGPLLCGGRVHTAVDRGSPNSYHQKLTTQVVKRGNTSLQEHSSS